MIFLAEMSNSSDSSGRTMGRPFSSLNTVVVRKKTSRRNAMSAIDAVGISSDTRSLRFRIAISHSCSEKV